MSKLTEQELLWQNLAASFEDGVEDKACDWAFGYLPSWERGLGVSLEAPSENAERKILDFGCGKGAAARYLRQLGVGSVYGVDTSAEMIAAAIEQASGVEFQPITDDTGLPFSDGFFNGVMANWVFCTMDDPAVQLKLLEEIYRVMRPGSPIVILGNNPYATGIKFVSIQSGESDVQYSDGMPIGLRLFRPGESLPYVGSDGSVQDIFWPETHFRDTMGRAGFQDIRSDTQKMTPQLEAFLSQHDIDTSLFVREREVSPTLWMVGYK